MIFPPSLFRHALLHAALLALLSVALTLPASSQTTLVGRVHDESGSPVPGANVLLLSAADSSLVQGAVTTDDGRFAIEAVAAGTYRLRVSFVGFTEHLSAPFVLNGAARHDVGTISLRPGDLLLDGVLVEARRSLFEQRSDRLIVNAGSSVTLAGTDALTVLQRSPGVVVSDQAGTVSLIGKRGVQILVNGRLTNVPPDALVQYLAGLNADAIERAQVHHHPSGHARIRGVRANRVERVEEKVGAQLRSQRAQMGPGEVRFELGFSELALLRLRREIPRDVEPDDEPDDEDVPIGAPQEKREGGFRIPAREGSFGAVAKRFNRQGEEQPHGKMEREPQPERAMAEQTAVRSDQERGQEPPRVPAGHRRFHGGGPGPLRGEKIDLRGEEQTQTAPEGQRKKRLDPER